MTTCHFCGHPTSTLFLSDDGVSLIEECDACGGAIDPVFAAAIQGTNHEYDDPEAD